MSFAVRKVRDTLTAWSGVIALALALIVGLSYYVEINHRAEQENCQAEFNEAFTKSLSLRADASNARLDALDALLTGFLALVPSDPSHERTPKEEAAYRAVSIRLFQDYGKAVLENAKVRAANPLPAIPDC